MKNASAPEHHPRRVLALGIGALGLPLAALVLMLLQWDPFRGYGTGTLIALFMLAGGGIVVGLFGVRAAHRERRDPARHGPHGGVGVGLALLGMILSTLLFAQLVMGP